jgi:hypothetical protein
MKLLIGLFALVGFSQAWAVPCSDTNSGVFLDAAHTQSASADCVDSTANNDPFPSVLNAFGMTYDALSKQNTDSGNGDTAFTEIVDIDLVVTPLNNAPSGTWSFTNVAQYSEYVIVLKDGEAIKDTDIKWSAYLLDSNLFGANDTTWSGTWVFGGDPLKGLSHLSVYGKLAENVPTPAILGVMGIGLMGMVFSTGLRRRKIS